VNLTDTEIKIIEIWRLFNQVQAIGDNREYCSLELTDDGYGWVAYGSGDDYLEFPGSKLRSVAWDTFDEGVAVLTEYLEVAE
jgi:hypothetical protein